MSAESCRSWQMGWRLPHVPARPFACGPGCLDSRCTEDIVSVSLALGSRQSGAPSADTLTGPSAAVAAAAPPSPGDVGQGRSEG